VRRSIVVVAVLLFGAPAHAASPCSTSAARGPVGLPQTIFVKGACGTLALHTDGKVEQVHPRPWAPAWAKKATARADARTYIMHPRRHLVLRRDGRTLWRSRLPHGSDNVVLHGDALAFTAFVTAQPDLWVARLGHVERLAARGEELDGWAHGGGFFTRRGNQLLLRSPDGELVRRLAVVSNAAYDQETETMVAVTTSRQLVRTDGRAVIALTDLRRLGFARNAWVDILPSGLIRITAINGLLLLRPDGTRYGSARESEVWSNLLMLPDRRGVVFVLRHGGFDRIVLLKRGGRSVLVLAERRAGPRGCAYWANLSLAGGNVLYWPSTGHALVSIDTSGSTSPRNLWPLVQRLPGFRHEGRIYRAAWATAWNA
jgi:hypothetical protein